MAFLLKLTKGALTDGGAIVPAMKSSPLSEGDTGETVFLWLRETDEELGALHAVYTLDGVSQIKVPQLRDPQRLKDAYRLTLSPLAAELTQPLTTQDLGPKRFIEGADGIESLGRIHRDRNDKIIRLTGAEADVLQERFRH